VVGGAVQQLYVDVVGAVARAGAGGDLDDSTTCAGRFIRGDVRGDGRFMVRMVGFGLPGRAASMVSRLLSVRCAGGLRRTHSRRGVPIPRASGDGSCVAGASV